MIYNVALVSGVQHLSIDIDIDILFKILFPYRLLQDIELSSLCYTVGPCCSPILYIVVCMYTLIPTSYFIPPLPLSPLVTINLFSMSVGLFLFCI